MRVSAIELKVLRHLVVMTPLNAYGAVDIARSGGHSHPSGPDRGLELSCTRQHSSCQDLVIHGRGHRYRAGEPPQ